MIEAVDTRRARGLRSRRGEAVGAASLVRRLDWILLAATGALVAYGLWAIAGITRHDVSGDANYYVTRQGVYAALGALALVAAVFVDHYNVHRPHRALALNPPTPHPTSPPSAAELGSGGIRVQRRDRLGGVVHEYRRAA